MIGHRWLAPSVVAAVLAVGSLLVSSPPVRSSGRTVRVPAPPGSRSWWTSRPWGEASSSAARRAHRRAASRRSRRPGFDIVRGPERAGLPVPDRRQAERRPGPVPQHAAGDRLLVVLARRPRRDVDHAASEGGKTRKPPSGSVDGWSFSDDGSPRSRSATGDRPTRRPGDAEADRQADAQADREADAGPDAETDRRDDAEADRRAHLAAPPRPDPRRRRPPTHRRARPRRPSPAGRADAGRDHPATERRLAGRHRSSRHGRRRPGDASASAAPTAGSPTSTGAAGRRSARLGSASGSWSAGGVLAPEPAVVSSRQRTP